ncbi:MAG TPA: peptidylprolyl isomerase [Verrucomicrobiae bacterium]|nr:peptidylprolyl isomerase [Verrucomicrobiae bacterium]
MKSFLKISGCLIAAMALTASAATPTSQSAASAPTPSIDDLLPDSVVAKGKGFEIRRSKLDQAVINYRASAAAHGQEIPAEQLPMLEKQALDNLMLVKLLNGVATADQKAKAADEAGTNFAELKKQFATEELMVRQFKASGLTPDQVRSNLVEQSTAQIVLASRVNITDDDIKKYYDDNPTQMIEAEKVRINFITLGGPDPLTGTPLSDDQKAAKKKQIEDIRDRAQKGEDFAKLAKEYSEDTASKEHGGEIMLVRGMRGLPPEFENAAFSLETNQVSDVITTQFGYHLLKMKERIPAKTDSLAEASPEIRKYLEASAVRKMLPAYYAELKKNADVEILDPKLKEAEMPPAGQSDAVDTVPNVSKPAATTH